jgi:hypothetical protein
MKDFTIEVERVQTVAPLRKFITAKNFVTSRSQSSFYGKIKTTVPVEIPTTAHMGKSRQIMDSNVFGGVIKKLEDSLTIEQLQKFKIFKKEPRKKGAKDKQAHRYVPSKIKEHIQRPVSQFD